MNEAGKWLAKIIMDEWTKAIAASDNVRGITRTAEQWEVVKRLTMLVCAPVLKDEACAALLRAGGTAGEDAARKLAREVFAKNVLVHFPN